MEKFSITKIGEIIKAKRKEQALTQEQLASCLGVSKAAVSKWEVQIHLVSTEDNIPYTIQKYIKPNVLIDGYSVRLADGKPIIDDKPNKHYVCKEKVWEYHTADNKHLKQMLCEQVAMGLIEDDDI